MQKSNQIAAFLEYLADATIICDLDSNIVFANSACCHLFGYSQSQLQTLTLTHLISVNQQHNDKVRQFINSQSKPRAMMTRGVIPCKRADGQPFSARISIANVEYNQQTCALATIVDYSQQDKLIQDLKTEANTDTLTGLFNKRHLQHLIDKEVHSLPTDMIVAAANIDLNGFKKVNDTYGHDVGDQLLQVIAQRLRSELRSYDVCFRLGGDEFFILFGIHSPLDTNQQLKQFANKLQILISQPIVIDRVAEKLQVGASIGLGTLPYDASCLKQLILKTDQAMYHAKNNQLGYITAADLSPPK